ncbi:G-protein coupled receptor GRL101-like [Acanthaster planci]|uniref:G-protein coupled receptor GRL101-like n=1 Tax=Acanthaster planci TaxID=133434 RepID=A0A8B7YLA1_ACAPL|nr:G-protein coupled receptor GRL101-like [Acanthaster planci]
MEVEVFDISSPSECSGELDLLCENSTFCVTPEAVCNGFKDCPYGFDEQRCYTVSCPAFFQCSRSKECILWEEVCDGTAHCLLGDDEINCDVNRCPDECSCYYKGDALYVSCRSGWTSGTLNEMAATTDVLELTGGSVSSLESGHFKRFFKLQALYLADNHIENIPPLSFDGLQKLLWLNISQNDVTSLQEDAFKELGMLQGLVISNVPVASIEESAFSGLKELQTLVLIRGKHPQAQDKPIDIHPKAVLDLTKLQTLYLDDYRLCCEFNKLESFDPANCFTTEQQSPLFNCGSLMQNTFLRASMWFLGLSALIGNFGVVIWRYWTSMKTNLGRGTKYVHNFLVLNLAVSDFLMGIYMVIIATADVTFGELYYTVASTWRLSAICKIAGIISVLSSEASVFFITLISVDRFLCVVFPHGSVRLVRPTARGAAVIIWFLAFILSSLPTILIGSDVDSDVYGLSDVCIGLPLITKPDSYKLKEGDVSNPFGSQSFKIPVAQDHRPAWVYSIVLFLGVNLLCFLVVALCYLIIFIKVRQSYQRVKGSRIRGSGTLHQSNKEEMNMALRMAVIVGTDFCCWMPVIIMGLLSQTGAVTIQPHMYAWTVVFVLPINSSINPYLYTIFSVISARISTNDSHSSAKATRLSEPTPKTKDDIVTCASADSCPESDTHL